MDNDASDTDRIGGMHDAPCGVSNHRAAEALALISEIDSEPREHDNGDWVGRIAPETTRSCSDVHGAGSQGKIGNDPVGLAHRERRAAPLAWLASARRLSHSSRETTPELKSPI